MIWVKTNPITNEIIIAFNLRIGYDYFEFTYRKAKWFQSQVFSEPLSRQVAKKREDSD